MNKGIGYVICAMCMNRDTFAPEDTQSKRYNIFLVSPRIRKKRDQVILLFTALFEYLVEELPQGRIKHGPCSEPNRTFASMGLTADG